MSSADDLLTPVPGVEPTKGGYYLWRYVPNVGAAVVFCLLFGVSLCYISWRIWKTRAKFCIVFAVGCLFELVGYAARISSHDKTNEIMPYAIQNMFIIIAPVLFAASIYMVLGRIIMSVNAAHHSLIRPKRLTLTFVLGDVVSFLIQSGGSGLMVIQEPGFAAWGQRVVMIGLAVQIVMFGLFCAVAAVFHRRMRKAPTTESWETSALWKATLLMLYMVSALIMIRSIFRMIEFAEGYTGYSLSHEWTLYIFDALLMWAVTVLFAWRFPGGLVPPRDISLDSFTPTRYFSTSSKP